MTPIIRGPNGRVSGEKSRGFWWINAAQILASGSSYLPIQTTTGMSDWRWTKQQGHDGCMTRWMYYCFWSRIWCAIYAWHCLMKREGTSNYCTWTTLLNKNSATTTTRSFIRSWHRRTYRTRYIAVPATHGHLLFSSPCISEKKISRRRRGDKNLGKINNTRRRYKIN